MENLWLKSCSDGYFLAGEFLSDNVVFHRTVRVFFGRRYKKSWDILSVRLPGYSTAVTNRSNVSHSLNQT